jgi:hypothetical protein
VGSSLKCDRPPELVILGYGETYLIKRKLITCLPNQNCSTMNDKLMTRFSIWDKYETVLFDSDEYAKTINEIGPFNVPLRGIGDKIKVEGKMRKISNIFFYVSEHNAIQNNMQIVIEVE